MFIEICSSFCFRSTRNFRTQSILNPDPLTRRLVDNIDPSSGSNAFLVEDLASSVPVNLDTENTLKAVVSKPYIEQTNGGSIATTTISKGSGSKASDSCILHSEATAYARLAESSSAKLGS
ncbi:uncharacterized protein LOC110665450 isoform X1 [Hevea brasiliensis]|uniref:uncharacterized protein LOC110665450 isoform X1 n=1 Tax=Hevea brasiliensis TaxID=3981 RepID=UPI0025D14D78|nr:uncharacterized protein LOC110665450 isoform X1 [Hevea brasiliensis]